MTTTDPADETNPSGSREASAHEQAKRPLAMSNGVREVCPHCGTTALISETLKHQLWCIYSNP